MTQDQRLAWSVVVAKIRQANAVSQALASGFVDNHGNSLGDCDAAADAVVHRLAEALSMVGAAREKGLVK